MQLEIRNAVERDRLVYNGLGALAGMAVAYLFFRRLSLTIITVLGPAIAILWTLGVLGGLDFRLNLFINVITPLILVSGFSDSMHLVFSIRRSMMQGVSAPRSSAECRAGGGACVSADSDDPGDFDHFVCVRRFISDPHLRLCCPARGCDFVHCGCNRGADAGRAA